MTSQNSSTADLYQDYAARLFRYCMTRVNNREIAEDIVAETFTRFMENENSKSVKEQRAWLVSIARNIIRDRYKQQKTRKTDTQPEDNFDWEQIAADEANVEQSVIDETTVQTVRQMLNQLPEETKEIVTLRVWEEFSFKEIAEVVGEKETTVKLRYYRAIDEMRKTQDKKARSLTIPLIIAAIREQSKLPEFAVSQSLQNRINLNINNYKMEKTISRFQMTKQKAMLIAVVAAIVIALIVILTIWATKQPSTSQVPGQPAPTQQIPTEPEPTPEPEPVPLPVEPAKPVLKSFTHNKLPGFSMQYYDDWTVSVAEDDNVTVVGGTFGRITATFTKEGVTLKVGFYFSQDDGGAFCSSDMPFQNLNGNWFRFSGSTHSTTTGALFSYSANAAENQQNYYTGDTTVYKFCDFAEAATSLTTSVHTDPVIALSKPTVTGDATKAQALLAEIDAMIVSMQGIK